MSRTAALAIAAMVLLAGLARTAEAAASDDEARRRVTVRPLFMFNQYLYYGDFGRPRGLAFDRARSELWIADSALSRIGIFRPDGAELYSFKSERHLRQPSRIAVRPDGAVAVLQGDGRVRIFDYRGRFLGEPAIDEPGKTVSLGAVAYDADGNLYVGSNSAGEVVVFDKSGNRKHRFGSPGTEEGQFRSIAAITIGGDSRIYVADHQALAVQIFDSQGNFIRGWGRHEMGADNFSLPSGLALDSEGLIYVSDELRHQVKVFDDSGKLLGVFGQLGTDPGELSYPTDIAIGADDRIYVSERLTARVQVFEKVVSAPESISP